MTHSLHTLWSAGHYLSWRDVRGLLAQPPEVGQLIRVDGPAGPAWPAFQVHGGHVIEGVGREPLLNDVWARIDWWTHPRTTLDGASVADLVRAGAEFDEILTLVGENESG
jgi:hypothetical protein